MNYILQLKQDLQANADLALALQESLREIKARALSPKHQGVAPDGSRNDWIASNDVVRWVDEALKL